MLIINLNGGLGNQLFQYAMARDLALKKQTDLKLDTVTGFEGDPYERRYALGPLAIAATIASPAEIRRFTQPRLPRQMARVWRRLQPYYWRAVVKERPDKQFAFDPNVRRCRRNAYLFGFWQHEGYFRDSADLLVREFALRSAPGPITAELSRRIAGVKALCVHVRRLHGVSASGDNRMEDHAKKFGSSPLEYYERAAAMVAHTDPDCEAFVFSDDPAWTQQNLRLPFPTTYVAHNGPYEAHEDLHLMSLCQHFIIANSTLSWWGAWLGRRSNKIVIAPRRWIAEYKGSTDALFPRDWNLL